MKEIQVEIWRHAGGTPLTYRNRPTVPDADLRYPRSAKIIDDALRMAGIDTTQSAAGAYGPEEGMFYGTWFVPMVPLDVAEFILSLPGVREVEWEKRTDHKELRNEARKQDSDDSDVSSAARPIRSRRSGA